MNLSSIRAGIGQSVPASKNYLSVHAIRLRSLLSAVFALGTISFLVWYGWRYSIALPLHRLHDPGFWLNLVGALVLYNVATIISAVNWRLLLVGFGVRPGPWVAEAIFLMTQVGKYLPGNVAHFVGRAALAKARGIPLSVASASVLSEQLLSISTATLFIGAGIMLIPGDIQALRHFLPSAHWIAGVFIAVGLCPVFLGFIVNWLGRWVPSRIRPLLVELKNLPLRRLLLVVGMQFVAFVVNGIMVAVTAYTISESATLSVSAATVIFAAAWVLGFIVPGAPGGIGVRETIMVVGFAPIAGEGTALAIALLTRLVSVVGDGTAFLLGMGGDWLARRRQAGMPGQLSK